MPRSAAQANIGVDICAHIVPQDPRRMLFQATVSAVMCCSAGAAGVGPPLISSRKVVSQKRPLLRAGI